MTGAGLPPPHPVVPIYPVLLPTKSISGFSVSELRGIGNQSGKPLSRQQPPNAGTLGAKCVSFESVRTNELGAKRAVCIDSLLGWFTEEAGEGPRYYRGVLQRTPRVHVGRERVKPPPASLLVCLRCPLFALLPRLATASQPSCEAVWVCLGLWGVRTSGY